MDLKILQLLLFLCMILLVSGVFGCIERERQALFKITESLAGDLSELTRASRGSEEDKEDCCNWNRVGCGGTAHVTFLDLNGMHLRGKISPAFKELQHLNHLYLGDNYLTIDNLDWLSNVSSLSYLELSGINLRSVTDWVQPITKLSSLEELYLSGCQLGDPLSAFDVFANSSLSSLSTLDLSHNDLTSISIFDSMFNFSRTLSALDLSYNQLGGPIPDTFSKLHFLLGNLNHLSSLDISSNKLYVSLPHLFQNLSEKISVQNVYLSNNQLFGSLPDITRFSSLRELYLSNNQLDGVQSQSLDQPSSLEILDLSYNQISGSLSDLRGFSSLYRLDLSGNQLKKLPKAIEKLSNLKFLNLSLSSLEGTITEHHLSNFTQLIELDLSFNNVSFNLSFDWTPPFQLKKVSLSHCNMGPHFPNWIRTQNSLRKISLSLAGISDTLPNWLWNMSSIDYLDLSHNNISGGMHFRASKLIFLDLSYNNLSGSIFNSCTISVDVIMDTLILSHNQLEGELPDCWMNFHALIVLNLANNKFSGKLPPTLGTLKWLAILHLGNNNFTGELPSSLKNCTQLRKLDLGGNKLTDTIPAWIGTHLTNLAVLSLRFNSFHGSIPTTICHLTNIHVLDFSRNNISGKIPRCLNNFTSLVQNDGSTILEYNDKLVYGGKPPDNDDNALVQWKGQESEYKRLRNLKGVDLSSNKLVGTIPQAFSDLRGLVFINLSRNHLIGNIISSIGQLDTLEWLDLSRNQLSGEIPNGLANLHFLSVMDLSYNNLTGKIPLSTQLQSFDSSTYAGNSQLCGNPLAECPHDPFVTDDGKALIHQKPESTGATLPMGHSRQNLQSMFQYSSQDHVIL